MANKNYFLDKLNYSLGNEDSRIEQSLMIDANNILCVAGSGARVLPLLANEPEEITLLDVSPKQLDFTHVRISAIKNLEFEDYLGFWGFEPMSPSRRTQIFAQLPLPTPVRRAWEKSTPAWSKLGWYQLGDWETALKKMGTGFGKLLRFDMNRLFSATTLDEQMSINKKYWPGMRLQVYFHLVANKSILNKLLYRGGLLTPGFELEPHCSRFLYQTIERLFHTTVARENFLLQWIFLGRIAYAKNAMPETTRTEFNKIKKSRTKITYECGDALSFVSQSDPFDAYSFSDIVSYMDPMAVEKILRVIPVGKHLQRTVFRSFLKHPKRPNLQEWNQCLDMERTSWQKDSTGVYRFHIFDRYPMKNQKIVLSSSHKERSELSMLSQ